MASARIPLRPAGTIRALLAWYRRARRPLPWRATRDPYRIWVSETMLQQTQVATVVPYYERFIARFPSVESLARAPDEAILKLWEGLGYYSRARNLHAAAHQVADAHGGRIPDTVEGLLALPGVGRYTAGAVASIAFGRPAPVLDGNVSRVLCRYLAVRQDPRSPAVRDRLWALAQAWIQGPRPGDVNQAWMELGATVCLPRAPACPVCPIRAGCKARRLGVAGRLPVRAQPRIVRRKAGVALIVERGGRTLLSRRAPRELLGGLWGFPSAMGAPPERLARSLSERLGTPVRLAGPAGSVTHVFTHFRLDLRLYRAHARDSAAPPPPPYRWVDRRTLDRLPVSTLDRKIAGTFPASVAPPALQQSARP